MNSGSYSIGQGEWWKYHGVYQDQCRHDQKVKEAVKTNLADLVSDEQITVADGRRIINVPLPELKEFRIAYDWHHYASVGQRDDGLDKVDPSNSQRADSAGKSGGNELGQDIEDAAVTLEEAADIIFEKLALPDLDPLKRSQGKGLELQPSSWNKSGLKSLWVRRATLREALKRHVQNQDEPEILAADVRYWQYDSLPADDGGAVVLAMMDTSGSMGTFEKYLAKSFFFWTVEFLRRNYPRVEIVFLAHDVRAREVDEETFFHRGSSGGTVSSSVYRLGLDILAERYPEARFNRYAFHFTDGGNLTSDNALAVEVASELASRTNLFGYGEIHDTDRNPSPLFQSLSEHNDIGAILLRRKEDIFAALEHYFGGDKTDHADTN